VYCTSHFSPQEKERDLWFPVEDRTDLLRYPNGAALRALYANRALSIGAHEVLRAAFVVVERFDWPERFWRWFIIDGGLAQEDSLDISRGDRVNGLHDERGLFSGLAHAHRLVIGVVDLARIRSAQVPRHGDLPFYPICKFI
jgi:hypothetical protein